MTRDCESCIRSVENGSDDENREGSSNIGDRLRGWWKYKGTKVPEPKTPGVSVGYCDNSDTQRLVVSMPCNWLSGILGSAPSSKFSVGDIVHKIYRTKID